MALVLPSLLVILSLSACSPAEKPFVRTFASHGRVYEVRFVEIPGADRRWGEDLVMRWRASGATQWHVIGKVEQVRLERAVRLPRRRHRDSEALVVSTPGGSAQFISVVEIGRHPPGLRVLLDRALDKGGFRYRFDRAGRLIGFKFQYQAWHVCPDGVRGHVFTAVNIRWLPTKHRFREGPPYVDREREHKASLVDVLRAIGSADLLGMEETYDQKSETHTYIYRPTGLLREKTPVELRSSKKTKVVVKYTPDPENEPYIAQISAVAPAGKHK